MEKQRKDHFKSPTPVLYRVTPTLTTHNKCPTQCFKGCKLNAFELLSVVQWLYLLNNKNKDAYCLLTFLVSLFYLLILFKRFIFLFCIDEHFSYMYISVSWTHSIHGGQKGDTGLPGTGVTDDYEIACG